MKILSLAIVSILLLSSSEAWAQSKKNNSATLAQRGLNFVGTRFRKTCRGARAVGIAASKYRLHGSAASVGNYQMNPYQPMRMQPMQPLEMSFPSTSSANIFGGQNIYNSDGTMTTTSRNIFGGQNITLPRGGMVTTMPNVLGGYNAYGPDGSMTTSTSNVFGGQNIYHRDGSMTTTMRNVFGGQNSYGPNAAFSQTIPNVMGGYNVYP